MAEYVAMLRGINVSGKNKIQMEDLKVLLAEKGFENLQTYIQSGNLVFNYNGEDPAKDLENAIRDEYGYDVPVIIRTFKELSGTLDGNPFISDKEFDPKFLYVTFLEKAPGKTLEENLKGDDSGGDKFVVNGKEIYVYVPGGYGKTKLNNGFFEKKLNMATTTRNWRTIKTLHEMCG